MQLTRSFDLYCPTKIRFGVGISSEAGAEIKALNGSKVLVVADPGIVAANLLEGIFESLKKENLLFVVFDGVEVNASLNSVMKASELQKKEGCDILLCVGGGSTIDTGKGVGCLATNDGPLTAYEGPEKYSNPPLPSVAVPTTAGTGSELSFGAVLYDEERNYKFSFRSSMQIPKVALLDPALLRSLPAQVAAASGLDALAHCAEAFVSKWSTLFTDAYCRENFRLVEKYLRRFFADPSDMESAGGMLKASAMGSMAFNTARLGLVHAMASPLGAHFYLSHGVACAVLMPAVIRYNLIACPDKYKEMAELLEGSVNGTRKMEQAASAASAIERLLTDLDMNISFDQSEITDEKISQMADETLSSGMQLTNPRNVTKSDVINVYKDFFKI